MHFQANAVKESTAVLYWVGHSNGCGSCLVRRGAVRKYKQARNGTNRVTPNCQVLTLIVITIAAGSAKAGHSRDVGPDIHGVLRLSIAYPWREPSLSFHQSSIFKNDFSFPIGVILKDQQPMLIPFWWWASGNWIGKLERLDQEFIWQVPSVLSTSSTFLKKKRKNKK